MKRTYECLRMSMRLLFKFDRTGKLSKYLNWLQANGVGEITLLHVQNMNRHPFLLANSYLNLFYFYAVFNGGLIFILGHSYNILHRHHQHRHHWQCNHHLILRSYLMHINRLVLAETSWSRRLMLNDGIWPFQSIQWSRSLARLFVRTSMVDHLYARRLIWSLCSLNICVYIYIF